MHMILAGDIGGTKTLVGLFEPRDTRPSPVEARSFPTTDFAGLPHIIDAFFADTPQRPEITAVAFGVAGPVINQTAQMTNVEWSVDAAELARGFALPQVWLLNDLQAMAYSVPVLDGDELHTLQRGNKRRDGNMGIIAAGTGLGGSLLHRLGARHVPMASEVGHADFAARTDRDVAFMRFIRGRHGRVEIEHLLCGPGLVNLSDFTHQDGPCEVLSHPPDDPADVSSAALAGTCSACVEALDMFIEAYGAAAGNLALVGVTTGGMFVGGGIAPRILPALETGRFVGAFCDKGLMRPLVEAMPVHVILNPDAGLLGAAVYANARSR
ncbi:MAG TPA: glucokinase [Vicinamibacterales bacterium]|nr:glucokinase [Vicinamibacterales bacterium]